MLTIKVDTHEEKEESGKRESRHRSATPPQAPHRTFNDICSQRRSVLCYSRSSDLELVVLKHRYTEPLFLAQLGTAILDLIKSHEIQDGGAQIT